MRISTQLFLTTLSALLVAYTAIAAPVSNFDLEVLRRADAEALTAGMELAEDFSISDIKNALSTAASVVKKIATTAKPIVDTIAKVAAVTPFAPEAALIDTAVNAATHIPVGAPAAKPPASVAIKAPISVAAKAKA